MHCKLPYKFYAQIITHTHYKGLKQNAQMSYRLALKVSSLNNHQYTPIWIEIEMPNEF
jgi:hypothetical protein